MNRMRRSLLSAAFVAGFAIAGIAGAARDALAVTNIDLGIVLDGSASVGSANFNAARNALASAINTYVPTSDPTYQYTVGVAVFGASGVAAVNAITINSAASKAAAVAAITGITYGAGYSTGSTCFNCAFNALNAAWSNSGKTVGTGIVNMTTDGNNNTGGTANNAILKGAGWDSLSFEGVGSSVNLAALVALGYDALGPGAPLIASANLINDPLNNAFTLQVGSFGTDYADAIDAKISRTVVPLPGALPLLASALGLLGWFRVRGRRTAAMAAA